SSLTPSESSVSVRVRVFSVQDRVRSASVQDRLYSPLRRHSMYPHLALDTQAPLDALVTPTIVNVLYVDGAKYNLLIISQFCKSRYVISFNKDIYIVKNKDGNILFTAKRHEICIGLILMR
ncbi:hypothetical protein CR513_29308, partial [Mucuna pruriens]